MSTIDPEEIQHFQKDSHLWWDPAGPFAPLHKSNPVRIAYLKDRLCTAFGRDPDHLKCLEGLRVLDIGCGGGLVCEPLSRLGADIHGIDADGQAIGAAQDHAAAGGLDITYESTSAENLPGSCHNAYDAVMGLELIEHVSSPEHLIETMVTLARPGGLVMLSTLNRTARSFLLGKMAAEYLLRWVPPGTHDWRKFLKPSQIAGILRAHGATVQDISGLVFDPLSTDFRIDSKDTSINYFITAQKCV